MSTCWDGSARIFARSADGEWAAEPIAILSHWMQRDRSVAGYRASTPVWLNDGAQVLTDLSSTLMISDAESGKRVREINVGRHQRLVVSPDGRFAGAIDSERVGLWDVQTGAQTARLTYQQAVTSLTFATIYSDCIAAIAGHDRKVHLVNAANGLPTAYPLEVMNNISAAAFSPDGQYLAVAHDEFVRVWQTPWTHWSFGQRIPSDGICQQVELSDDGKLVCPIGTTFRGCTLTSTVIIDVIKQVPLTKRIEAGGILVDGAFSRDSQQLVTAASSASSASERERRPDAHTGRLRFWDTASARMTREVLLSSEPRDVAYTPDGKQLIARCADGQVFVLSVQGDIVRKWALPRSYPENGHYLVNGKLHFSPDGRYVVTYGELSYEADDIEGCPVRVYELATGKLRYELPTATMVFGIGFSNDGSRLATAHVDRAVRIWDFDRGKPADNCPEFLPHSDWVFSARFSQDDKLLLTAGRDGIVRLWDWRTGELLVPPMQHGDEVFDAVFAADEKWIVTACADSNAYVRDAVTGQIIAPPMAHNGRVWSLGVTPDGKRVFFSGLSNVMQVWSLQRLTAQASMPPERLCEWFELVAGKTLYENIGLAPLTPGEWLNRWNAFRVRSSIVPKQLEPNHLIPDLERRYRDISKGVRELLYKQ